MSSQTVPVGTLPRATQAPNTRPPASRPDPFADTLHRLGDLTALGVAAFVAAWALVVAAPGAVVANADTSEPAPVGLSADVRLVDGRQVLGLTPSADGFLPTASAVMLGHEVRWEIDATVAGCPSTLDAPGLGLGRVHLTPGRNVVTFTPTATGTYRYACAGGLAAGTLTVFDPS